MASLVPPKAVQRRHLAAMQIVQQLDPQDRVLLLGYVVGGTERILDLEAQHEPEAEDQVGQPA